MRKLIYGINLTLDGCCDHTKGSASEEVHQYFTDLLREADALLYGRKTYELMVPFWPDMAKDQSGPTEAVQKFADAFNEAGNIVVVSKTLEKVEDNNTQIIRNNLRDEIIKLKQQEGRAIMTGGVDVPSQLIELGLVDEYHVVVHPVLAGKGRRLLEGIAFPEQLQLKLAESKVFSSGHVALRYVKE